MRDALPQGYNLNIKASDGSGSYDVRIVTDIGRGGSSFVYKGIAAESIHDGEHTVIVKELFPDIEGVLRGGDNALVIPDDKQAIFEEYKISFIEALQKQRDFYEGYKDQCMPPPFFTGLSGNSLYSVSDPGKGRLLLKINKDELSLGRIASIMRSLSLAISKLHARQMLYLDCKPDNFFYSIDSATEEAAVFLFDFDTVSDIKKLQSGYYRFCSCPGNTQWAAPEQIPLEATKDYEDPSLIGFHTDVYSVGAVFFWLLTGRSPSGKDITKISQDTFDWEGESVFLRNADSEALTIVKETARVMLEPDVRIRRERCGKYNSIKRLSGNFERMTGFTGGTQKSFEPVHKEIKKINKRLLISVICAAAAAAAFCIIFFTSNRVTDNKLTQLQQTLTGAGDHIISYTENALHSYEMGLENWRRLDYGKAERDISRALEEITKTGSESDIEVARINNSLGCLYLDMGRLTEAYDLLNSAYITFREAYGENEPETVAARFSIAQYDYLSGDTNKSLRTIQRIIDELDTESNSAIAVSVLNYQAGIYNELGKYDDAIKTYEAALSVYDELINTGRLPEFSRMSGDASLKRKYNDLVNDAYEKIALTYNDLGGVYILQEDSDKATQILQKGLDICLDNKAIGLENLTTSKLYMNMARACGLKNNLTQGIDDVDLAVRIQKKLFDFEAVYPGLVQVYCVYGELLERKDDFDTAYSYYQNAVSLAEQSYGENHPVTAEAYYQFGRFFLKRNIPHAAVENIRRAVEIRRNILGEKHIVTAGYLSDLSEALTLTGDTESAAQALAEAERIRGQVEV